MTNTTAELAGLLGLTDYEARAYLGLLREGPLTGYAVARASGIPSSKSYEAVEGLARKGGAALLPGEPPRYSAVPPDALLAQARLKHAQALEQLGATLADAARPAPDADTLPLWRAGREAGLAQTAALIGRAERSVVAACPPGVRERIEPSLTAAARQGVLVQSVGSGDSALTVLLDDREAVIGFIGEPAEFIGSANPAIVSLCRMRLREASSSPFLRPSEEAAEWLRWEEQKAQRLLRG